MVHVVVITLSTPFAHSCLKISRGGSLSPDSNPVISSVNSPYSPTCFHFSLVEFSYRCSGGENTLQCSFGSSAGISSCIPLLSYSTASQIQVWSLLEPLTRLVFLVFARGLLTSH